MPQVVSDRQRVQEGCPTVLVHILCQCPKGQAVVVAAKHYVPINIMLHYPSTVEGERRDNIESSIERS